MHSSIIIFDPQNHFHKQNDKKDREVRSVEVTDADLSMQPTCSNEELNSRPSSENYEQEKSMETKIIVSSPFTSLFNFDPDDSFIHKDEVLQLDSTCTSTGHEVHEKNDWTTTHTITWEDENDYINWSTLSKNNNKKIKWKVYFCRWKNDNFSVNVRCQLLDNQIEAVSFRLFAVVEGNPHTWTEGASVLKSGDVYESRFSKKFSELPRNEQIRIQVTVSWTELHKRALINDLWKDGAACISCSWQLNGWKSVTPTSTCWNLYSEPFGRNGALWRIVVGNRYTDSGRELVVWIMLQHLPAPLSRLGVDLNYSLNLFSKKFGEVKKGSWCEWKLPITAELELCDPLDLKVDIEIKLFVKV